jgi:hypothetical protein
VANEPLPSLTSANAQQQWKAITREPAIVMHVFIAIPLLARVTRELLGADAELPVLRGAGAGQSSW